MDGVHVDGDSGSALVVARVHQARRHLSESFLACADHAVIAGQDFVLFVLAPDYDGRQEAVARNGLSEGRRLLFGEVLRIAP